MSSRTATHVCAVIVTFYPDPDRLSSLLSAVIHQVGKVVVVDNGSAESLVSLLDNKVTLLELGENLGVAAGFNRGIGWAEAHGFKYVLLLDQDSLPLPDMVMQLQSGMARLVAMGELVAAVGPVAVDPRKGSQVGFARMGGLSFCYVAALAGEETVPADFLISSGSLISMAALQRIGPMDEGLFIDLVDTEWFLRARASGYRAYGVAAAQLQHGIGEGRVGMRVGNHEFGSLSLHSPIRHYYIFRNSVTLSRRAYVPRRWVLNNTVQLLGMFVYFSLLAPAGFQHLRMMLRGAVDGLKGVHGCRKVN